MGLLQREGREGRAPLYRATAKLVEIAGTRGIDELRQRLHEGAADLRGSDDGLASQLAVS